MPERRGSIAAPLTRETGEDNAPPTKQNTPRRHSVPSKTRHLLGSGTGRPVSPFTAMIAITITAEAFEAVRASPFGQAMVAPPPGPDNLIRIWLDRKFVDRLCQMRGPGESYSGI